MRSSRFIEEHRSTKSWGAAPDNVPVGRSFNAFAYDPRNEVLVMNAGQDDQALENTDEVWTYDPWVLDMEELH